MLTILANAKINLYLEVVGDRPDGFHELVMVMQSVALCDRVTLTPLNTPNIRIECNHPQVPTDSSNLAYKAVTLLQKTFPNRTNQFGGVKIDIDKKIPVGAGLAGGSSNAAATLLGLNMLWNLGLTRIELQELGAQLGSDIPFCFVGGCAIATGRGEEVASISHTPKLTAVLAKYSSLSVSTPWAYKTYRQQFQATYQPIDSRASLAERQARIRSSTMVKALRDLNPPTIGNHLHNDLEKVVLPAHPKVAQLRATMTAAAAVQGGLGTVMSGSGPTVFTLCEMPKQAEAIAQTIRQQISDSDLQLFVTPFTAYGLRKED